MSRPSSTAPARPLTLTEELEKLEQSITLTLQEIDHNFSKAHRIVTGSILPLVEQYGEHSRNVWEATKFWKQFFEASANVSLSGYEELANNEPEEGTEIEQTVDESTSQYNTPRNQQQHEDVSQLEVDRSSVVYPSSGRRQQQHRQDESMFDNSDEDVSGSTPRPPVGKTIPSRSQMAALSSPYETLKREYAQKPVTPGYEPTPKHEEDEDNTSVLIQEHTARLPDMSMHPRHSPDQSQSQTHFLDSEEDDNDLAFLKPGNKKNTDPVLHHLKDKNFRILATPHKGHTGVSPLKWKITENKPASSLFTTPGKGKDPTLTTRPLWADSPGDSPEIALPQLRSAAFMSPQKAAYRSAHAKSTRNAVAAPRTPGVSVQTPAAARGGKTRDVYLEDKYATATGDELGWSEDDDEDERELSEMGMSPPKTIQFALPPGRLLQTPAREASRRIVEGLLMRAGEDDMTLDFTGVVPGFGQQPQQQQEQQQQGGGSGRGGQRGMEYSPTLVKMSLEMQDDTF